MSKTKAILLISLAILGLRLNANHWTPVGNMFEDNMTLTGVILIDGEEQYTNALEVGVFCGTECRGSGLTVYFPPEQRYVVQLTIFGEQGDLFSFKLFDHNLEQELDYESPSVIAFTNNGCGDLSEPHILDFTSIAPLPTSFTFIGSDENHYWSVANNWAEGMAPTEGSVVTIKGTCYLDTDANIDSLAINDNVSLTILNGKSLISTKLLSDKAVNLIIEDGGQLFTQASNVVKATMKKEILGYGNSSNHWYLVASPTYTLTHRRIRTYTTGMTSGTYDLYLFDIIAPGEEWENYKDTPITTLSVGFGYLYAHQTDITLTFAGTLTTTSSDTFELDYDSNDPSRSYNLVGNPYSCLATINLPYYVLNANRDGLVAGEGPIAPCEAVFVKAEHQDQTVTFTPCLQHQP